MINVFNDIVEQFQLAVKIISKLDWITLWLLIIDV